jgi:catechol 2,3-dioxygenase-like lactoylglutathione lyase family enzyme
MPSTTEATIPLFPCKALKETLDFYRAIGFEVTYQQEEPYLYGAVQRDAIQLHFSTLTTYGAKNAFGATLVFVPDVGAYHRDFADGLRTHFGRIPTAGLPRITRLPPKATRFKLFDPTGNLLIFINQDETDAGYEWSGEELSPLAEALENAIFLRDTYANDEAAARVLDKALAQQHTTANPLDLARALAARAELAVALGDTERATAIRQELRETSLSDEERARFRGELEAADQLERWIG